MVAAINNMASKRKNDTKTGVTPETKGRKKDDENTTKTYAQVTEESIAESLKKKQQSQQSHQDHTDRMQAQVQA